MLHLPFYSKKVLRVYFIDNWEERGGLHGCGISVTVIGATLYLLTFNITIIYIIKKNGIEIVKIKCKMIGDEG